MKLIIITTVLVAAAITGLALSAFALYASQFTCVDPLPYIATGTACFIGLLASIHNFNRNQ